MRCVLAMVCVVLAGCDLHITNPAPVVATTGTTPTITNTNTNTSTNNNDRSDTQPTTNTPTDGTAGAAVPLPTYGEGVVRGVAANNPALLANSCQETSGDSAWDFLDLAIRTLRAQDQRWGYLCKDANCLTFGRDVITYRATAAETGIWIVDVIGNHCPGPTDPPPAVRWGILPFETVRKWSATRKAGVF
jgi:hypothetical protein